MTINLKSPAFKNEEMIPKQYTCYDKNVSPPLEWSGVPASAKSIAIITEDPDAPRGVWTHWVVYNLPADIKGLPEEVPTQDTLKNGAEQGINDSKNIGYGGPCPPSGVHRYYFKIYALDEKLPLKSGSTKGDVVKAMKGHILAEGQLMGKYKKVK
ncbi:MAG: YbhB/YbcL family Raf kinase inhibitor-like protein [Candidatus Margulisiibacteriota bacterium]|nr:MAG: phosphatidylethanolamine-binding protein [Candidatus Margulisbacteria bacterium GWD2_39_127]OGI02740.1 MAG: phosphatidylethanolamine-binding protein [Candidatus Margulisbacteria bacterium GWF2_38_17]OGI09374.1 MAG: phosphatidylethanolamine-binding protein [Candidatus Margulisbacteria bacterium GWE2_39_32]PZM84951.1 MAG: YbhB/YbcL family Raf kinase inhibitor-like protein [Candidatus Margulisiibacteriota bacterium]HAR63642.1 YbhB/YbcL family Raf kinase inhibitor-like protein [Candidatus M